MQQQQALIIKLTYMRQSPESLAELTRQPGFSILYMHLEGQPQLHFRRLRERLAVVFSVQETQRAPCCSMQCLVLLSAFTKLANY